MGQLDGKIAIVTGAARGIGRAIARSLASQGARLILPWHDWPESVAELKQEFGGQDRDHLLLPADVRQAEEVAALVWAESGFAPFGARGRVRTAADPG